MPRTAPAAARRPHTAVTATPATPRPTVKPAFFGVVPRTCSSSQAPRSKYSGGGPFTGVVVNVNWSDIQPTLGGTVNLFGQDVNGNQTNTTEWVYYQNTVTGLGNTFAAGTQPPPCILRLHLGTNAPTYAWNTEGPGTQLDIFDNSGNPGSCGRWWTASYAALYDDLMTKVAAIVEPLPYVREVTGHIATTFFVEPCQRANGNQANRQAFVNAGLFNCDGGNLPGSLGVQADPLDQASLLYLTQAKWLSYGFATTPHSMRFNPFQQWQTNPVRTQSGSVLFSINGVHSQQTDPGGVTEVVLIPQTAQNMTSLQTQGNNSARVPFLYIGPPYPATYQTLNDSQALGSYQRQTFQTGTLQNLKDALNNVNPGSHSMPAYVKPADLTFNSALIYTLQVFSGTIYPVGWSGTAALPIRAGDTVDVNGFYGSSPSSATAFLTTPFHGCYIELPNNTVPKASICDPLPDGSPGLTDAQIATFAARCALNPDGT